jgi:hypothetical protein
MIPVVINLVAEIDERATEARVSTLPSWRGRRALYLTPAQHSLLHSETGRTLALLLTKIEVAIGPTLDKAGAVDLQSRRPLTWLLETGYGVQLTDGRVLSLEDALAPGQAPVKRPCQCMACQKRRRETEHEERGGRDEQKKRS